MPDWRRLIPDPLRWRLWNLKVRFRLRKVGRELGVDKPKYASELEYWQRRWEEEGGKLRNDHYRDRFLAMAGEDDDSFCQDKIVADFGCGPRGSLCWAESARLRIGVDVLADYYTRFNISFHNMCYVCSTETHIPLPSNYVDIYFTLNAMDHVDNFEVMCREVLRTLSPGGLFIGSFNLDEPPGVGEPQRLTEERIRNHLLRHLEVTSFRIAPAGPGGDRYKYFSTEAPPETSGPRTLWVRARRRGPMEGLTDRTRTGPRRGGDRA